MNIEADPRSCEEIATSKEYKERISEEHRLMDEGLGHGSNSYPIGHPPSYSNPLNLYFQGAELNDRERLVVKLFGSNSNPRIT